ncbi:MAG: adenylate kinase [Deltaproteobacteria bacterium]
MNIVLLGPPGAGKGTQAKVLAKKLNVPHISTGDLLRDNVARGTELGAKAKDYMNKGLLVPDELVLQILGERLKAADIKKGFILDGYPRNLNQAKELDGLMARLGLKIDRVIDLVTSESVIVQRLSGRLVCRSCGALFHRKNMPPKKEGVCDACGGELYQRADDKEETIRKRLTVYREEVAALLKYYEEKGLLTRVAADEEAAVVLNRILKLVGWSQ